MQVFMSGSDFSLLIVFAICMIADLWVGARLVAKARILGAYPRSYGFALSRILAVFIGTMIIAGMIKDSQGHWASFIHSLASGSFVGMAEPERGEILFFCALLIGHIMTQKWGWKLFIGLETRRCTPDPQAYRDEPGHKELLRRPLPVATDTGGKAQDAGS